MVEPDGDWLLQRVDGGPILRGLWLPPLLELVDNAEPECEAVRLSPFGPIPPADTGATVRHNITHRKIDVIPVRFYVPRFDPPTDAWRWVDPKEPGVPTSSLLQKLVNALKVWSSEL